MGDLLVIQPTDASLMGCVLRRFAGRMGLGAAEAAGVGFFQNDDVLVRKRPLGSQLAVPEKLAEGVESEVAVVATRSPGTKGGIFKEDTTPPFRFRRWMFALAGAADALDSAREGLFSALPDSLRRSARGDAAAEALFLCFLSRLRDAGQLDAVDVEAATAARALAGAIGEAERILELRGEALPPIAAIATNGRGVAAVRRGYPLALGEIDGVTDCARCEISHHASELDPRVKAHRVLKARLLLSGRDEGALPPSFTLLADREVLAIGRDLRVERIS